MVGGDGILSGPIDLDGPRRRRRSYRRVEAHPGLVVSQRGTPLVGRVVETRGDVVILAHLRSGREHRCRLVAGGFEIDGEVVTLLRPAPTGPEQAPARQTASGSVAVDDAPARVARASRLLVEGIHDAELVEKVWGDDLRGEGVVVERLDGADHLDEVVRSFGPGPGRRLGILLDHLVAGSKEAHLAAAIDHPDVAVTGHPYVDIWQAIKPSVAGIAAWPEVQVGLPWKEGVLAAIGAEGPPGHYWRWLLGRVSSWTDLEPSLIGAVEELIDFVTAED